MISFQHNPDDRFLWQVPMFGGLLVFAVFTSVGSVVTYNYMILGGGLAAILLMFLCTCFALSTIAHRKYRLTLSVLCLIPTILLATTAGIALGSLCRTNVRWLLHADEYKSLVLKDDAKNSDTFQHSEWDFWGFAGAGTTVEYLVYDPYDQLSPHTGSSGKFGGLPCEVYKLKQMETHWYVASFYTNTAWDHCS